MAAPKLVISRLNFDASEIAAALKVTVEDAISAFQDGRGAWPFSEIWGERLYEFIKHSNTNNPLSDGAIALEQLRNVEVSVKALTKGTLKFQQSKFVGYGRATDQQGLISSIEACDRIIVVDITEFPLVRFVPIDATRLVSAAHKGRLTTSGWRKVAFYAWLHETYEVSEVDLSL
tara:strand:- start:2101 stop:2625 length:525 start_codon:yes stop_codon:yes gene_type:complete